MKFKTFIIGIFLMTHIAVLPVSASDLDLLASKNALGHWDQATRRSQLQLISTVCAEPHQTACLELVPTVTQKLSDANCGVRTEAARALTALQSNYPVAEARPDLERALGDKIASVREAALNFFLKECSYIQLPQALRDKLANDEAREVRQVTEQLEACYSRSK